MCEQFERFVRAHEDCFERSCIPGHITGSAWLLNRAGDQVLLTHHRKLNMWLQLGGHSDGDARTDAVAQREAEEESGLAVVLAVPEILDLDVHVIPARAEEPEHLHYDVRFAFLVRSSEEFVVSEESNALAWVPVDELDTVPDEVSMLRMARKWRELSGGARVRTN